MSQTITQPEVESDMPFENRRTLPRWLPVLTVGFVLAIVVGFVFISRVEDFLGIGLDMVMLVTVFGGAGIMLCWAVWFLFYSGWNWAGRVAACGIMFCVPYAAWKILRPVNGGDATIVRFEPIWESRDEVKADQSPVSDSTVDLTTESDADFAQFLGPTKNGVVRNGLRLDSTKFS